MGSLLQRLVGSAGAVALAGLLLVGCSGPSAAPDATSAPGSTSGGSAASETATPSPNSPSAPQTVDVSAGLAGLETRYAARVGVSAVDTGSGRSVEYRADERFGYSSTLKVFAAAEFLRETAEADRETVVTWTQADVDASGYSPITSQHLADGLTLSQLAEAAVRSSDNTALNLVLDQLGGPGELDSALSVRGDTTTEVVNREPELNLIEPGSTDDTTTPRAFMSDLQALVGPNVLVPADRDTLLGWMAGNTTGDTLVRAGAPTGWVVADKSGGAGAIRNDIAVVTPPGRAPIIITVLTTKTDPDAAYEDALVAETASVVLGALG